MASSSQNNNNLGSDNLTPFTVWKGENESDAELMEGYDSPLTDAGAWTEKEAYKLYREELVRLRDLYVGQLDHMQRSLKSLRRQFLLQWQHESRKKKNDSHAPPTRQANSAEELACRRYRRKSGEEALVERKAKMRRLSVSMEYFVKSEGRTSHRLHYQYLRRQQNRLVQPASQCTQMNCDNKCLAHSVKCSRHICDDPKQYLFTKCSYVYPSGQQCTNPVPKYLNPLLCGGHCDNIKPPKIEEVKEVTAPNSSGRKTGSRKRKGNKEEDQRSLN